MATFQYYNPATQQLESPSKPLTKNATDPDLCQDSLEWYTASTRILTKKAAPGNTSLKSMKEAKTRTRELATSSDRTGISFSGQAFQAEYFQSKFTRRGQLLHRVLQDVCLVIRAHQDAAAQDAQALPLIPPTPPTPPTTPTPPNWSDKLTTFYTRAGNPTGKDGTLKSSPDNVTKVLTKYKGNEVALFRELFKRYNIAVEEQDNVYQFTSLVTALNLSHSDNGETKTTPDPTTTTTSPAPRRCCLGNVPSYTQFQTTARVLTPTHPLTIRVGSFGGGPGTDAAGLVWFQKEHPELSFEVQLFDYETSWKRYMKTLNTLFGHHVNVTFAPCDVSQKLPLTMDEKEELAAVAAAAALAEGGDGNGGANLYSYETYHINTKVREEIATLDVLLFFYVCHETAAKAKEEGHVFYRDVATHVKEGALMVICDVMERSRKEMLTIVAVMGQVRHVEVLQEKRKNDTTRHTTESMAVRFGKLKEV
jgi:hypothetical protein